MNANAIQIRMCQNHNCNNPCKTQYVTSKYCIHCDKELKNEKKRDGYRWKKLRDAHKENEEYERETSKIGSKYYLMHHKRIEATHKISDCEGEKMRVLFIYSYHIFEKYRNIVYGRKVKHTVEEVEENLKKIYEIDGIKHDFGVFYDPLTEPYYFCLSVDDIKKLAENDFILRCAFEYWNN